MQNVLEGFRLAGPQQQLWTSSAGAEGARSACALGLAGELDPERLRAALAEIVSRHSILRTSYQRQPGLKSPLQVVSEETGVSWRAADLSGEDAARREDAVEQAWRAALSEQEGGGAVEGAPLRATLARLGPQRHLLLVSLPALSADEATFANLLRELAGLYGAPAGDADEPVQYLQFSAWLEGLSESDEARDGAAYWQGRRPDAHEQLTLPLPTPTADVEADVEANVEAGEVGPCELVFGGEELARLDSAVASLQTSAPAFLLACWETLLHRLTGAAEFVIGARLDGRRLEELREAFGLFARWLPLRCRPDADAPFTRLLQLTAESLDGAAEWQEFYAPDEGGDAAPAGFDYQTRPAALRGGGVTFSLERAHTFGASFGLLLRCVRGEESLRAELHYDRGLYAESGVRRLALYLRRLVNEASASPSNAVGDLELLGEQERRQVVEEWNRTAAPFPSEQCLHELFEAQAERTPDSTAVACGPERVSFAELNARANRLAHFLRRSGVGPDSRVGILLERSTLVAVALLGVLKAGAAYVPLEAEHPPERLSFMVKDSGVEMLLTQGALASKAPAEGVSVFRLDEEWARVEAEPDSDPARAARPDNLAYIIYTSGSTGRPKGVMIEHRGLVNYLHWARAAYDVAEGDGAPVHSPLGFDLTVTSLFAPLLAGRRVTMLPESEGLGALAEAMREGRGLSLVKLTPSHLELLSRMLGAGEAAGRARAFIVGGEALTGETLRFWLEHAPDTRIINEYGPTETVVGCCVYEVAAGSRPAGAIPIGRPIANTRLYVLDARLRPVPVGVAGELYIGGAGVARGYVNGPGLTAERFIPDPFSTEPGARLYRTGDLARHGEDGNIEFLGRRDSQVKIRGYRIELGEVETVLRGHPGVREACAVARADGGAEQRLVAYFVGEPGQRPRAEELRRHLRQSLPEYMLPTSFVALDALPLTHNGKVDHRRLPAPEPERPESETPYAAPGTELERAIAQLWQEALRVERVGLHDNFFDLGAHSFHVVAVGGKLAERFGEEAVSLVDLFSYPTVSLLARHLGRGGASAPAEDEQSQARAEARLSRSRRQRQQRAQGRPAVN